MDTEDFVIYNDKKYKINEVYKESDTVLGQGSFGKVVKGINKITGKTVAIKLQHKDNNDIYEYEINMLNKIKQKCKKYICLDGWGVRDGLYFIVMEYFSGITLTKFIKQNSITTKEFLHIGNQLKDMVKWIHSINIAHQDIKPDNIMIDSKLNIKLIDFGLACSQKICTSQGSPYFMPDELFNNNTSIYKKIPLEIRKYTDYYSLIFTMVMLSKKLKNKKQSDVDVKLYGYNTDIFIKVPMIIAKYFKSIVSKSKFFNIIIIKDVNKVVKIPQKNKIMPKLLTTILKMK